MAVNPFLIGTLKCVVFETFDDMFIKHSMMINFANSIIEYNVFI